MGQRTSRIPLFLWILLCTFVKLELLRYFFFSGFSVTAIIIDLSSSVVMVGLFELLPFGRAKRYVFWLISLLFSFMFFASTLYYNHFGSVPTYTALKELHQVGQIGDSVKSTIRPIYYIYFVDILVMLVIWVKNLLHGARTSSVTMKVWKSAVAVLTIASLIISFFMIRQNQAVDNELALAENLGFFNYQVAAGIKAHQENLALAESNLQDIVKEIEQHQATFKYVDAATAAKELPKDFGIAKGKNLIVVQMEAFQNFLINLKVNNQEITPVLNQLQRDSYYFPHVFQQIGQGNTSDAEFMSNTSIYPTGAVAMSTGFGDRKLPSLPRLLEQHNYEADTFHVNDVKFWDRIRMYPALNFNHYYDKPFYQNDQFNSFGASDEELYRVGVEKLSAVHQQQKPFYAQFVTVSSHFPFDIPKDKEMLGLPADMQDTQIGKYLQAQRYTDYALGKLIDDLKQAGLWDNTVLVVYGDHFGLQPQDNDTATLSQQLGITYNEYVTRFNIPFMIRVPGMKEGQVINRVGGQLDMMPTVANLLGISLKDEQFTAFGHDLLNIDHNILGIRYYMPTGTFMTDDILFIPGQGFDDGQAISLKTFQPIADISPYRADYDYIMKYMSLSDKYVKLLPKRTP